jgi:hypothetical protein
MIQYYVPVGPRCKIGLAGGPTICWNSLDNIIARIIPYRNGTFNASSNVILLSSHYDTVTISPGAYDDTTGVVTMLEIVSMFHFISFFVSKLTGSLAYQNWTGDADIIALWNNGQEMGSLGANAFDEASVNSSTYN